METVLQESILALTFNHERSSIIYLAQPSFQGENPINELIELDLHNQTVLERYIISKQLPNQPPFMLITSKRKGYLILAFQPSLMEIWQLGNSTQGFNQSVWSGETRGRGGYEIQHADVSNLDGILFFNALNQRNIYCANIDDTIQSNSPMLNLSKLRLPEGVNVTDIKCHPSDYKVCAACSDGFVRVWNQNTSTELCSITDEQTIILSLAFQQDGQKLLCGCDNGKIFCYDAKTLGNRNILLAVFQLDQNISGVLCLHWVNYNGANNCNQFLAYFYDGNIKLLNIKLLVPQEMIRDQKISKSKKQELFGSIKEIQNLLNIKNDLKSNFQKSQPNIGLQKFIQIHPYANFVSINSIKVLPDQTLQSQIFYQYKTQIILLNDNTNLLAEYPVCSQQYSYSFKELLPDTKSRILTQRYLYYIDQHTFEIKQYCLAKGELKAINLRQMILVENPIFYQLSVRPNTLKYSSRIQFLLSYKMETTYRCCTVMLNEGILSDNLKEFPARFSMFLGLEHWINPPLFLLYDDRSSYSIIFEDTLQQEEEMIQLLNKQDKDKLQNQMKQSLNLKVSRMFWTPLRSGFVVIYQPMNENILKFSRNRNPDNNLLDLLMQSGQDMIFKFNQDEQITDLVWQKDNNIGAIVTIHNVYIINDNLITLKLISLQPQVNKKNRILLTYWIGHSLILQTKFHILYVLLNGICASIQSIDNYEEKNVLSSLLWDRMILLCQSHQKKQNTIEIKTKCINIFQPILQGYIHNQKFFNEEIDEQIVTKLLLTFANPNIDYSLVKDLEQFVSCAKYIIQLDDCRQFTLNQKTKFYINTLDHENCSFSLFGNAGIINNEDLQQQLIKKIKDRRYEYLSILLQQAKKFYLMTFQYKIAAEIDAVLNKNPAFILQILKKQKQIENIDSFLIKEYNNHDEAIQLAHKVLNQGNMYFKDNLQQIIDLLTQQQQTIKNEDIQDMKPSYYFTDFLLERLTQIQKIKSLSTQAEFGKDKFNLVYEDQPNEEDEEENITNGRVIRYFDRLSYDSIVFFLGVGGQPQAQKINDLQQDIKKEDDGEQKQDQYDFDDDDTKEFQDLLIYWRIDEGKGCKLEDYGNYECQGDIFLNKVINPATEHLWMKLEESNPMEWEDKWGKKNDPQCGFELGPGVGFQTRKKNYWKKTKLQYFTIEMWLNPQESSGQIFQVGSNLIVKLHDSCLEVIIFDQIRQFNIEQNDEENPLNKPQLKLNFWNHICLTYEQSASTLFLYLAAKYQFSCQDLDIPHNFFKGNVLIFGETTQQNELKHPILKCQITEFRFWKQKFSLAEIRDGFRTPLSIVNEKKKKLVVKIKGKQAPVVGGLNSFKGMMLGELNLDPTEPKPPIKEEEEQQEIQSEKNFASVDGSEQQPPSDNFGWFGAPQQAPQQTAPFSNNFEFDSNFGGFGQPVQQASTQMEWGNEFSGFDSMKQNDQQNTQKVQEQIEQPQQQQKQKPSDKKEQKVENIKIQTQQIQSTDKGQPQNSTSPQKNSIQEIQTIVDQAIKMFGQKQTAQGVQNLGKAFEKLNQYLLGNKDKLQKIQKFIVHCGQYRFAFQLLKGIKQMNESGNKKKELYLHLILIHQNLVPSHKLHWILQTIYKCIEYENTALADTLLQQLKQSIEKVKMTDDDIKIFKECEMKLQKIEDKKNQTLYRMNCPNCKNHIHFKGIKKCNKCNKEFSLCQLTLACIQKDKCLKCKACESIFSDQAITVGDQCPNCKLDNLIN